MDSQNYDDNDVLNEIIETLKIISNNQEIFKVIIEKEFGKNIDELYFSSNISPPDGKDSKSLIGDVTNERRKKRKTRPKEPSD